MLDQFLLNFDVRSCKRDLAFIFALRRMQRDLISLEERQINTEIQNMLSLFIHIS